MDEVLPICRGGDLSPIVGLICKLNPLLLLTSLLLALLVILYIITQAVISMLRHRWTSRAFVGAARSAQRELRERLPHHYPPTPHVLSRDMQGNSAPTACAVCLVPVLNGEDGVFCMMCGTVAHVSCRRSLKKNCRPLALPPGKAPMHDWRPAGCTLTHVTEAVPAGQEGEEEGAQMWDGEAQCCLYCNEPCEVGLISLEPMWVCSGCHCLAHVQCFVLRHPNLFSPATKAKLQGQLEGLDERDETSGDGIATATADGGQGKAVGCKAGVNGCGGFLTQEDTVSELRRAPRRATTVPSTPSSPADVSKQHPDGSSPEHSASNNLVLAALDGDEGVSDEFERCGLGPAARCVLPPTFVRANTTSYPRSTQAPMSRANSGEPSVGTLQHSGSGNGRSQLSQGLAAAAAAAARKWGPPTNRPTSSSLVPLPIDSHHAAASGNGSEALGGMSPVAGGPTPTGGELAVIATPRPERKAPRKSWWKRDLDQSRWSGYSLADDLPVGLRPLLVFLNLKSGPQLGRTLHLQLLQLLHPLQVVELPREDPMHALRFFAPASSLTRILVMGGDGTVGWVLQALDQLAQEQPTGWAQPPVGIMPLGTGNDLARCLGWGASARLQGGLVACLLEVAGSAAHPVPLDRWNIAITPRVKAPLDSSQGPPSGLKRLLTNTRDSVVAAAGAAVAAAPAQAVTKTLNNYMGVGIDAQVALQFHQARSAFPFWFQSQLGNKVWYTGLGAPDLLRRSCVDLRGKLTLECDGVEVPVPADAQGLVVINIPCHMGGVYLWESGLPAPPVRFKDPSLRRTAAALTSNKRMGLADGLIEVVAIGGVAHMGRLACGLARAQRLAQCSSLVITTQATLPMQVDGEPWMQDPCSVTLTYKNQGVMLRRVGGGPAQRVVAAVNDALDASQAGGLISGVQKAALAKEVGKRLEAVLA